MWGKHPGVPHVLLHSAEVNLPGQQDPGMFWTEMRRGSPGAAEKPGAGPGTYPQPGGHAREVPRHGMHSTTRATDGAPRHTPWGGKEGAPGEV